MQRADPFAVEWATENAEGRPHIVAIQIAEVHVAQMTVGEGLASPVHGCQIVGTLFLDAPLIHSGLHSGILDLDHESVVPYVPQIFRRIGKLERKIDMLRAIFALPGQGIDVPLRFEELSEGWRGHPRDVFPLQVVFECVHVVSGLIWLKSRVNQVQSLEQIRRIKVSRGVSDPSLLVPSLTIAQRCECLFE